MLLAWHGFLGLDIAYLMSLAIFITFFVFQAIIDHWYFLGLCFQVIIDHSHFFGLRSLFIYSIRLCFQVINDHSCFVGLKHLIIALLSDHLWPLVTIAASLNHALSTKHYTVMFWLDLYLWMVSLYLDMAHKPPETMHHLHSPICGKINLTSWMTFKADIAN